MEIRAAMMEEWNALLSHLFNTTEQLPSKDSDLAERSLTPKASLSFLVGGQPYQGELGIHLKRLIWGWGIEVVLRTLELGFLRKATIFG